MFSIIVAWRNILIGAIFVIALMPVRSYAVTTEVACYEIQKISKQMQPQFPISIDYATNLIGLAAIYAGSVCIVSYSYVVDADVFLNEMIKENGLSLQANIEFLVELSSGISSGKFYFVVFQRKITPKKTCDRSPVAKPQSQKLQS